MSENPLAQNSFNFTHTIQINNSLHVCLKYICNEENITLKNKHRLKIENVTQSFQKTEMPYSTHDSIPSRLKHGESAVVGKTVSVANIHLGNITSNCPAEHLSHTTGEVGSFTRQLLLGDCVKSEVKSRNYSYFTSCRTTRGSCDCEYNEETYFTYEIIYAVPLSARQR